MSLSDRVQLLTNDIDYPGRPSLLGIERTVL